MNTGQPTTLQQHPSDEQEPKAHYNSLAFGSLLVRSEQSRKAERTVIAGLH